MKIKAYPFSYPGGQNQTARNSTGKVTMTKSINDKPKSISRSNDTKSAKPKSHI
ncbi:hypothetical protein IC582_003536 [Cucumis melo]